MRFNLDKLGGVMRKFGRLENGEWICQLTVEEVGRLKRREGVRKNRAKITSKFGSIAADYGD